MRGARARIVVAATAAVAPIAITFRLEARTLAITRRLCTTRPPVVAFRTTLAKRSVAATCTTRLVEPRPFAAFAAVEPPFAGPCARWRGRTALILIPLGSSWPRRTLRLSVIATPWRLRLQASAHIFTVLFARLLLVQWAASVGCALPLFLGQIVLTLLP